ncbi:ATPase [Fibrobacterales bacterium]|nr:ATPase [Fibrobacterales bacterium]
MFKRNIEDSLEKWMLNQHRKPLIIRGTRQVGKTTLIKGFASKFDNFLHLNLDIAEDLRLFERPENANDVLNGIYFLKKKQKKAGKTLLFIDEIQNSPQAVALLRYFYEECPDLFVIAAGSLLESLIDKHISFPVGRVEYLALRPCSFSEFLGALGEEQIQQALANADLPTSIHSHAMKLFNEYVLVGGMPEAVATYAPKRDFVAVQKIYETLLNGYIDDSEKYANNKSMQSVLRYILMFGWHFAGERIRFDHFANSNYKSREVGDAFRVLEKSLLVELCYPTSSVTLPLLPDIKKSPKLLWFDTGLVNFAAKIQQDIFGSDDISSLWRGRIAEHIVAQLLLSNSNSVLQKRNFWVRNAKNSQAEVDFVLQHREGIVPIEVKSGDKSRLKSLHLFMEESNGNKAVRVWNNPFSKETIALPSGKTYELYSVPFYYVENLERLIG